MKPVWDEFVHHPFVMAMGNGKMPIESFKGYIIQDYLYLVSWHIPKSLGQEVNNADPLCKSACVGGLQGDQGQQHHTGRLDGDPGQE